MTGPARPLGEEPRSSGRGRARCLLANLVLAAGLAGCGSLFGSKPEIVNNDPPDVIYGQAEQLVDKGNFADAARQYEEVDINHPYSQEARRAIVMAAYAYYKAGKYTDAVSAADRYLTLHPGTQESDLAQNFIGMSYYDQVLDP
jgi:outer membrane protein assembly factor BamD